MRIQIPIYAVPSMIIIIIKNNNDMTSFEEINKKLKASILYIYIYIYICVCVCVCENYIYICVLQILLSNKT